MSFYSTVPRSSAVLATLLCPLLHASPSPADPEGVVLMQAAQTFVAAYHAGEQRSGAILRVVYFHPQDRDPLPAYAERLDRALTNVSEFYGDGLRRFGIENDGLPFEKKDGRIVLHLVKGKFPAQAYKHESGEQTAAEIRAALADKMALDREHVLVLYALCRKEPDGRYVFDAPYYGRGSAQAGICHAADCELLDPALLNQTSQKIVYTEHYYPRMEQTVAKFNSMYLGGTAHELGHGLGLPHDAGTPAEKSFGTSLMGMGNLTYRQEVWGDGAPVVLTRASALQLLSHPLVTGSDRGRWDPIDSRMEALAFSAEEGDLKIEGRVAGKIPPYGVIAYVLPVTRRTDHDARTFPAVVSDGKFIIKATNLSIGTYHLKLATLHVNGSTSARQLRFGYNSKGALDTDALNESWIIGQAEAAVMKGDGSAQALLTDEAIAAAPSSGARRKLRILRGLLDPAPPTDLRNSVGTSVYLSDAQWTEASVGWGKVARNFNWFDERINNGIFLSLGGEVFEKGLYAHSPSRFVFPTGGRWKTFSAVIGLRDGAQEQGSAVFKVRGDGKELYRSPILRVGSREEIKVDISGVKELELIADGGEGHPHNSWAIWAEPMVAR